MASLMERYDSALLGIIQSERGIENFLDVVFGFLYRKTDFYVILKEQKRIGFPPGVAMQIAMGAYKKYEREATRAESRRQKQAEDDRKAAEERERKQREKEEQESAAKKGEEKSPKEEQQQKVAEPTESLAENGELMDTTVLREGAEAKPDTKADEEAETDQKKLPVKDNGDDDDDPEQTAQQKAFQNNPESYNGARRDNYAWSQSINDVDARIFVPKWVRKGADVKVSISKKYLKVCYKEQDGTFKTVVDEPLTWDIRQEESMWSLVPGEHVHVNLEKIQERWWEGLIESEPKISVRKIDPSRPITDLDDAAQSKIEEMMFNERQKKLGKPQSHEVKMHSMLKDAWNLEGSPFRGQPFDPSKVNIQNPGSFNMGS